MAKANPVSASGNWPAELGPEHRMNCRGPAQFEEMRLPDSV